MKKQLPHFMLTGECLGHPPDTWKEVKLSSPAPVSKHSKNRVIMVREANLKENCLHEGNAECQAIITCSWDKHFSSVSGKIHWLKGAMFSWPNDHSLMEISVSKLEKKKWGRQLSLLFSHSVMSYSLRSHGLQHAMLPCPSPSLGTCSNWCPSSQWCHPTISSSVVPFSFLQSFPASGSFLMNWLVILGGQRTGVSPSASILPKNIQSYFL